MSPITAKGQETKAQPFIDVTAEASVADKAQGQGMAFFDYDSDGSVDIFLVGRAGDQAGRGIIVADVDEDGWSDLFMTWRAVARESEIETIKIEGGKVEITSQSIKIEGGKVEISRNRR
jgi:hypothetical protein